VPAAAGVDAGVIPTATPDAVIAAPADAGADAPPIDAPAKKKKKIKTTSHNQQEEDFGGSRL
jgi:hypothetical protein